MVLSPELDFLSDEELNEEIQSSRTHRIDFENGRITGEIIDGIEAIKQFIYCSLRVSRFSYPIYTSDIGNEIHSLLSDSEVTVDFKIAELPRLITEALIYDDRIESVNSFEMKHIGNALHSTFRVVANDDVIDMQEVFELV